MTSSRPYLLRAIYEWIVDNNLTPYILVDAMAPHVEAPERFVEDGRIILNIAKVAVANLVLENEFLEFDARFSGITHHIYVPIEAIHAIYAHENGRGMVFNETDLSDDEPPRSTPPSTPKSSRPPKKNKPHLKIVK